MAFISMFFLLSLNVLAQAPFSGGDGSTANPWQITTIAQLDSVRNYPDSNYVLMNDLDFTGSYYDTANSDEGWLPVSTFSGNFNGAGHTISNLYINRPSTNNLGLFGRTSGAVIDSLGIIKCNISGKENKGALVGQNNSSTISNCYATGKVYGGYATGGLVGRSNSSSIINCYTTGEVSGYNYNYGGLIGYNSSSNILNCYSTAKVKGYSVVGGLVGYNYSSSNIINSYATGTVSGGTSGGLVGSNRSSAIQNCYAVGKSGTGGLVGSNSSSTIANGYYNTETSGHSTGSGTGLTTAQMKQQSSFTGFNFDTVWAITNGKAFPRLQTVYNMPYLLHDISSLATINSLYTDTIHIIPGDDAAIAISLANAPEGIQLQDSMLTWVPDSFGRYAFSVLSIYPGPVITEYPVIIAVMPPGEGTEADPFQISTIEGLNSIRYMRSGNYILMNDLDFSGSVYDSANSAEGWSPIGNESAPFSGIFNGKGHAISNLYINRPSSNYIGLFGMTSGSVINSLAVVNCNINGNSYVSGLVGYNTSSSILSYCYTAGKICGTNYIGGLAGYNSSSDISNCYTNAEVSGDKYNGGLVGFNSSSTMLNCYATGRVSGFEYTGGLVGSNSLSTITNGFYNTEISGQSTGIGYDNNSQVVTGLSTEQMKQQSSFSGFNFDTVWNITNGETFPRQQAVYNVPVVLNDISMSTTIDVLYTDTIHIVPMDNHDITLTFEGLPEGMQIQDSIITWVPGSPGVYNFTIIAADANNYSSKLYTTISVVPFHGEGTEASPYQVTSIEELDYVRNHPSAHYILMNDLDFTGSIFDSENSAEGWEPIGEDYYSPFTGSFNGAGHVISNLYINRPNAEYVGLFAYSQGAKIDSLGVINCMVSGKYYTGCLLGMNYYLSIIRNCYATGKVSGIEYVGGLVGYNTRTSTLTNCYTNVEVSGDYNIGGLVGENTSGEAPASNILNCYATGKVSGLDNTGGLAGYNSGSNIINGYYNTETSGQSAGIGYDWSSQVVTGLSTAQMKQDSSFSGFSFDTVWYITNGKTLPRLKAVYNAPLILHDISSRAEIGILYSDTIHFVAMDNETIALSLENSPEGMQIQDSIITWTPPTGGAYTFNIVATDANQVSSKCLISVVVMPEGEGTEENPFRITTIAELNTVRYLPDSNYILMNDLDFTGSIYDRANSAAGWGPIGSESAPFSGSFNGSGHTVNSLYINRESTNCTGLFGQTNRAIINGLGIINFKISGGYYAGSLVGYNNYSTLTNCYATGEISGTYGTGCLVGDNYSSSLLGCYATGKVSGGGNTGGLVGTNAVSSIINCYATTKVSGNNNTGGLVGYNVEYASITNCYTAGEVSGSGSTTGGLVGKNTSSTVTNGYYNTGTSKQNVGIGADNNSQAITGLTTTQMKQQGSFTGFSFDTVWTIRADSTYPALLALENAPFAFPETIQDVSASFFIEEFLFNDYDYETIQEFLVIAVESISSGSVGDSTVHLPDTTEIGDEYIVYYKVGEVRTNDTLWGNMARSILVAGINNAPVLTAVKDTSIMGNTPVTLSIDDVTASDSDGDPLTLIVYEGDNYTFSGTTVTPETDYTGTLLVPVAVTDGIAVSNIINMSVTIEAGTGINNALAGNMRIFPNPVSSSLSLQSGGTTIETIQLVSIDGRVIYNGSVDSTVYQLDMHDVKPGMYILRIRTGKGMLTHMVIKE